MEDTETWYTQQREYQHRVKHLQSVCIQHVCAVKHAVYNCATDHHNSTVNKKYAPVWQRVFRKIPVQYLVEWIPHITIFF